MYIFQNTLNTRPILENSIKYIRSDVPTKVSESEKNWLLSNNVTTIIDLRTDEERTKKQCPLIEDSRFTYYVFTITGGDKVPLHTDDVSKSYIGMVDAKFCDMIEFNCSFTSFAHNIPPADSYFFLIQQSRFCNTSSSFR